MTLGIKFLENVWILNPVWRIQIYTRKIINLVQIFWEYDDTSLWYIPSYYSFGNIGIPGIYIFYNAKIVCWSSSCIKYIINNFFFTFLYVPTNMR